MTALLEVEKLVVEFGRRDAPFRAVKGLDLTVDRGQVVGMIGGSGSGKSVSSLALMGLTPHPGRMSAHKMLFDGADLLAMGSRARRSVLGVGISMIFQNPMNSLNPCFTVGFQIDEMLRRHVGGSRRRRQQRAIDLLTEVGVPDPQRRLTAYPHQLSGGMSQRVMIAMMIASEPKLLIADEATTALDVTIQEQVVALLLKLRQTHGMALIFITHDLALAATVCDHVYVMHNGEVVESGSLAATLETPRHPYTRALIEASTGCSPTTAPVCVSSTTRSDGGAARFKGAERPTL